MHYTLCELDHYRNRTMFRLRRFLCRLHLLRCSRCRVRLAQLAKDDLLIFDLRNSEQRMKVPANPAEFQRLHDMLGADRKYGSTI